VFLLARQTITLLLQSQAEHGCLMGSLYLDEHKEEVPREHPPFFQSHLAQPIHHPTTLLFGWVVVSE
jgi:hypothetical protein